MEKDVEQSIENMEKQLADRDLKIEALGIAIRALSLKLNNVDEWIERVNLAFVKELAK